MADNQPSRPLLTEESFSTPEGKEEFVKRQQLTGISRTLGIGQPSPPKDWFDIGRSTAAAAANIPALMVGTPKDIYSAGKMIEERFGQRLDRPQPGQQISGDELAAMRQRQKEMEQSKAAIERFSPFAYMPSSETLKGLTAKVLPFAGYESQTPEGQSVGQAVSFGGQLAAGPGGLLGAAGRFTKGAIGSLLGQKASDIVAKGTSLEPYAEPLLEIGGTALAGGISGMLKSISADASASNKIAKSLAEGFRNGQTRMTPEQVKQAIATGTPISIADIADPQTKQLIEYYAGKTGTASTAAAGYNRGILERFPQSQDRIQTFLAQDIAGVPIDAPAIKLQTERANKKIVDNVYDISRADPSGRAIFYSQVGPVVNTPIFQDAMKKAAQLSYNRPDRYMVPGVSQAGTETAGNLSYWDLVKRQLDERHNYLYDNREFTEASMVDDIRNQLKGYLDTRVPAYKTARDVGSEAFGANTAPEAGVKFFGRMDDFKRANVERNFANYTDEQKDLFRHGFVHALNNEVREGRITGLSNKLLKNQNFQDNMRFVLGDEQFNLVKGKILGENIRNTAEQIVASQPKLWTPTVGKVGAIAAFSGAAFDQIFNTVMQASMIAPEKIGLATVAGLTTAGAAGLSSVQARRLANKIVPLATSTDPKKVRQLAELAESDPRIADILYRTNILLQQGLGAAEPARENQNTGGRVARASGGKVDIEVGVRALMNAAENAKKSISKTTENSLKQPDENIAQALNMAKRHI